MTEQTSTVQIISTWHQLSNWSAGWTLMRESRSPTHPSLWLVNPVTAYPVLMEQYADVLSQDEQQRASRFHQALHSTRYLTARILLRLLLGHCLSIAPSEVQFDRGPFGKPMIRNAQPPVHFNLSYAEDRILIGVAPEPVGVDVEWLSRPIQVEDLLEACFTRAEISFITADPSDLRHRFFTLWSRKEAILKLTGVGIGNGLSDFEVLDGVSHTPKHFIGEQAPSHAYLYSFDAGEGFIACVASASPSFTFTGYRL